MVDFFRHEIDGSITVTLSQEDCEAIARAATIAANVTEAARASNVAECWGDGSEKVVRALLTIAQHHAKDTSPAQLRKLATEFNPEEWPF